MQFSQGVNNKQEQMYVDIVQLVANIAKDSFGVDIANNPLFSGVFKEQLQKNHQKIVGFILKYVPAEPIISSPPFEPPIAQQEHTLQPQPVSETIKAPWPNA